MNLRLVATLFFAGATFILGAVASGLISANVRKLADKHGWDNFLVHWTENLRWQWLRAQWWLWSIFGIIGGITLGLWLSPVVLAPRDETRPLQSQIAATSAELDSVKQQLVTTQSQLSQRQSALDQTRKQFSDAQEKINHKELLADINKSLNLMWPAQEIIRLFQGNDDSLLITAAANNANLAKYLIGLIQFTALDLWIKDHAVRRDIIVQLPNYQSDLDAPRFETANYPGISIHGEQKYMGKQAPFRNAIADLFGRMRLICNMEISYTQKALPELSQYYKHKIIWIEIGNAPLPQGTC
jgi:hypothetical protein